MTWYTTKNPHTVMSLPMPHHHIWLPRAVSVPNSAKSQRPNASPISQVALGSFDRSELRKRRRRPFHYSLPSWVPKKAHPCAAHTGRVICSVAVGRSISVWSFLGSGSVFSSTWPGLLEGTGSLEHSIRTDIYGRRPSRNEDNPH